MRICSLPRIWGWTSQAVVGEIVVKLCGMAAIIWRNLGQIDGSRALNWGLNKVCQAVNWFKETVCQAKNWFKETVCQAVNWFKETVCQAVNWFKETVCQAVNWFSLSQNRTNIGFFRTLQWKFGEFFHKLIVHEVFFNPLLLTYVISIRILAGWWQIQSPRNEVPWTMGGGRLTSSWLFSCFPASSLLCSPAQSACLYHRVSQDYYYQHSSNQNLQMTAREHKERNRK